MGISFSLAFKQMRRNKKRTFFLFAGIFVIMILAVCLSIIMVNNKNQAISQAKLQTGNWHIGLIADNQDVLNDVKSNPDVSQAAMVYHLNQLPIVNSANSLDIYLTQPNESDIFVQDIVKGYFPTKQNEILMPDWYLSEYQITDLPAPIQTELGTFYITGSYLSSAINASNPVITAYMSSDANSALCTPANLQTKPFSYGNVLANQVKSDEHHTSFVFIRLKDHVRIDHALANLEAIQGLHQFPEQNTVTYGTDMNQTPLINQNLMIAENRDGLQQSIPTSQNNFLFYIAISVILLILLFLIVFLSMHTVVKNGQKTLGIFSAVGFEPKQMTIYLLSQAVFVSLLAIPSAVLIGIFATRFLMYDLLKQLTGNFIIPYWIIGCLSLFCFISVCIAAFIPAVRASKMNPLNVISQEPGISVKSNKNAILTPLARKKGSGMFAVSYGIRNLFQSKSKLFGIFISILLLFFVFTQIVVQINVSWITGFGNRQPYTPDYTIKIPYHAEMNTADTSSPLNRINMDIKTPTADFLKQLQSMDGVKDIFYQNGVIPPSPAQDQAMYYYTPIAKDELTSQAQTYFSKELPIYQNFPNQYLIGTGFAGYDDAELNFAKQYLVEGSIDVEQMKEQPMILLPKYMQNLNHIDIPYTDLKVGDTIKVVGALQNYTAPQSTLNTNQTYTFTIGGFVSALPFEQTNGAREGFTAIMSSEQLYKQNIVNTKPMEYYIDAKASQNNQVKDTLQQICNENHYTFVDNKNNFGQQAYKNQVDMGNTIAMLIIIVVGFVVLCTIFYLLLSSVALRGKEYAMLHAIGMTTKQIIVSVFTELFGYILLGTVFGSIISVATAKLFITDQSYLAWYQLIPFSMIWIAIGCVLVSSLIAGGIGAMIVLKDTTLERIRNE